MPSRADLLLLLAVLAVFGRALRGDYVYDDLPLIAQNAAVRSFDVGALLTEPLFGAEFAYWRPLTSLLHATGHHLGGAAGIHALALALHAANTLLVRRLAQDWLGTAPRAAVVALWFAVHPVQVESVAWCSALNEPLWVLFTLLALRARRDWRAGVFCLGALLSKENALAALPIVGLVGGHRRHLVAVATAGLCWWALRALAFGDAAAGLARLPDLPPLPILDRVLAPGELLLRHLGLLAAPAPLTPLRAYDGVHHGLGALGLGLSLAAALWLVRGGRSLAPARRSGVLLLLVPLALPVLCWRGLGAHPIGERYLYLSVAGAGLLLVHACGPRLAWLPWLCAAAAAPWSFLQTANWRDPATFAAHAVRSAGTAPRAHLLAGNLALQRAQAGDAAALATASAAFAEAERLAAARAPAANRALADALVGRGWCLVLERGGRRDAFTPSIVATFARATEADGGNASTWFGLGVALAIDGRSADAERALLRGLELDPRSSVGWCNLGDLYVRSGRRIEARAALQRALRCDPANQRAAELLRALG